MFFRVSDAPYVSNPTFQNAPRFRSDPCRPKHLLRGESAARTALAERQDHRSERRSVRASCPLCVLTSCAHSCHQTASRAHPQGRDAAHGTSSARSVSLGLQSSPLGQTRPCVLMSQAPKQGDTGGRRRGARAPRSAWPSGSRAPQARRTNAGALEAAGWAWGFSRRGPVTLCHHSSLSALPASPALQPRVFLAVQPAPAPGPLHHCPSARSRCPALSRLPPHFARSLLTSHLCRDTDRCFSCSPGRAVGPGTHRPGCCLSSPTGR